MTTNSKLTQDNFNSFLYWLSHDRENAGKEYERIRVGLIRFFRFRGCEESEMLADETITRVAAKLCNYNLPENMSKLAFCHGFAKNLYLEYLDKVKLGEFSERNHLFFFGNLPQNDQPENIDLDCLDKCLSKLKAADRKFIIAYYSGEKREKIETRKEIAKKFNISLNGLHVKAFRIRELLKNCILNCFEMKIVK